MAIFLIIITLLLSGPCYSATIAGVSGTVADGETLTISGSGFGTKSPAAPLLWETFDSGQDGSDLSPSANWTTYVGPIKYSNTSPYGGGGLCVENIIAYGDPYETRFASANFTFSGTDELYYSYMNRHVGASTSGRIYKNGRINTGSNKYSGDGMIAISDGYIFYRPGSTSVYPTDPSRYFSDVSIGSSNWQRHEIYGKVSDPAGSSNGHIFGKIYTHLNDYPDMVSREDGYSFQYTSIILGTMMDNPYEGETHYLYVDDVYVDSTIARVELCHSSTWSDSILCDVQIPTAWSSSSISVTVNQGGFNSNETGYLYVIDPDGNVSNSYTVSFSGAAVLSNPIPASTLEYGTTGTTLGITSDSNSTCKYSLSPGVEYSSMTNTFSSTGGTTHTQSLTGLTNGQNVPYYVRCDNGTAVNDVDYIIYVAVDSVACSVDNLSVCTEPECEALDPLHFWWSNECHTDEAPIGGILTQEGTGSILYGTSEGLSQ